MQPKYVNNGKHSIKCWLLLLLLSCINIKKRSNILLLFFTFCVVAQLSRSFKWQLSIFFKGINSPLCQPRVQLTNSHAIYDNGQFIAHNSFNKYFSVPGNWLDSVFLSFNSIIYFKILCYFRLDFPIWSELIMHVYIRNNKLISFYL